MLAKSYHGDTDGMPTVDAGNLSDWMARGRGSKSVWRRPAQGLSDKAGIGKSEKPSGNSSRHWISDLYDLMGKRRKATVDTNRPSDEITPTESWLSKSMV